MGVQGTRSGWFVHCCCRGQNSRAVGGGVRRGAAHCAFYKYMCTSVYCCVFASLMCWHLLTLFKKRLWFKGVSCILRRARSWSFDCRSVAVPVWCLAASGSFAHQMALLWFVQEMHVEMPMLSLFLNNNDDDSDGRWKVSYSSGQRSSVIAKTHVMGRQPTGNLISLAYLLSGKVFSLSLSNWTEYSFSNST